MVSSSGAPSTTTNLTSTTTPRTPTSCDRIPIPHIFIRKYLGPIPVPTSSSASLIAKAISQDALISDHDLNSAGLVSVDSKAGKLIVLDQGRKKVRLINREKEEEGMKGEGEGEGERDGEQVVEVEEKAKLVHVDGPDGSSMAWIGGEDSKGRKVQVEDKEEQKERPLPSPITPIKNSTSTSTLGDLKPISNGQDQFLSSSTQKSKPPTRRMNRDLSTNSINSNVSFISATSVPQEVVDEEEEEEELPFLKITDSDHGNADGEMLLPPSTPTKRLSSSISSSTHEKSKSNDDSLLSTHSTPKKQVNLTPQSSSPLSKTVFQMEELVSKPKDSSYLTPNQESENQDLEQREKGNLIGNLDSEKEIARDETRDRDLERERGDGSSNQGIRSSTSSFKVNGVGRTKLSGNGLTKAKVRDYSRRSIGASDVQKPRDSISEDQEIEHASTTLGDISKTSNLHPHFDRDVSSRSLNMHPKSSSTSQNQAALHERRNSNSNYHNRDFSKASRQSRMSRVSTVGTFNSVGTRNTEGSFGTSGMGLGVGKGVREKMKKVFGGGKDKGRSVIMNGRDEEMKGKAKERETDGRRELNGSQSALLPPPNLQTSKSSKGLAASPSNRQLRNTKSRTLNSSKTLDLQDGSIGVSAGGTKWVGGSFQVGDRFWGVLKAREKELLEECEEQRVRKELEEEEKRRKELDKEEREEVERDRKTKELTELNKRNGLNLKPKLSLSEIDPQYLKEKEIANKQFKHLKGISDGSINSARKMTKSPSDVLSSFREEANDLAGEKTLEAVARGEIVFGPDAKRREKEWELKDEEEEILEKENVQNEKEKERREIKKMNTFRKGKGRENDKSGSLITKLNGNDDGENRNVEQTSNSPFKNDSSNQEGLTTSYSISTLTPTVADPNSSIISPSSSTSTLKQSNDHPMSSTPNPSTFNSTKQKSNGDIIESRINWNEIVGFLNTHQNHKSKPVLPPLKSLEYLKKGKDGKKDGKKEVEKERSARGGSSSPKHEDREGVTAWGIRTFENSIGNLKGWSGSVGYGGKDKAKESLAKDLKNQDLETDTEDEGVRPSLIRFETAKEEINSENPSPEEDDEEEDSKSMIIHSEEESDDQDPKSDPTTYQSASNDLSSSSPSSEEAQIPIKSMTTKEALTHPVPPIEAENKYPELTLSWLRRSSDGHVEATKEEIEAALDRRGSAPQQIFSESPIGNSPDDWNRDFEKSKLSRGETLAEVSTEGEDINEEIKKEDKSKTKEPEAVDPKRILIPRPSILSLGGASNRSQNSSKPEFPTLSKTGTGTGQKKKVVQFEGSSKAESQTQMRSLFQRSSSFPHLGTSGTDSPSTQTQVSRIPSGDESPRPPSEVLARPDESLHGQDLSTVSADANVDVSPFGSTPNTPNEVRLSNLTRSSEEPITRKSVLKRDRMLVKIEWTNSEDLPPDFNELAARKYSTYVDKWREYMVVMRMGRLELWDDPTLTSKALGRPDRLKLRYIVPLRRGRTDLSIYSSIDRIFCLTFQSGGANHLGEQGHKGMPHLRRSGTNIMIFDCRSRSSAGDWVWELWRELGGTIPEALEVHVPALDLRVRIPIPDEIPVEEAPSYLNHLSVMSANDSQSTKSQAIGEGFKLINRDNIVSTFTKLIASVPNWKDLMKAAEKQGSTYELAWRRGTTLDWITEQTTVEGHARTWAVISGMILKSIKHPSILELRTATHYPTNVRLPSGAKLEEPPAIEGFIWRVKPVSGTLTRLYVTSQDGHLFVNRPSRAYPPDRHLATLVESSLEQRASKEGGNPLVLSPSNQRQATNQPKGSRLGRVFGGNKASKDESFAVLRQQVTETISSVATTPEEVSAQIKAYQAFEKRRQFEQISGTDGYVDVRDIFMVRCVGKGPIRRPSVEEGSNSKEPRRKPARLRPEVKADEEAAQREDEETDEEDMEEEDLGGEGGLANASDRNAARLSRQFDVIMVNGRSIRFEAYSASVARDWIEGLSGLSRYWKRREKADAQELMDAAGLESVHLKRRLKSGQVARPLDQGVEAEEVSHALGSLWNWCTIKGCRGILKSGSLFHKRKAYSAFSHRYYLLIAGRLLCFKLLTKVSTARARQNAGIFHRRQETVINLRDSYVYSGKLTEEMLSNGRSEGAQTSNALGGGSGGLGNGERHKLPRVYRDGLLSIDEDEDCTFVVRYRPQRVNKAGDPSLSTTTPSNDQTYQPIPNLKDKTHKFLVLRARSKMERDLWVRAISLEMERSVREDKEREDSLRNLGQVPFK